MTNSTPSAPSSTIGIPSEPFPSWPVLAIAFCGYFFGAKLGLLSVMPEGIAILWPPNALILALVIQRGGKRLLPIIAVVVAAEVAADVPTFSLAEALLFGLINSGEVVLAWWLLSRWHFNPRFPSLADVGKLVVAGPIAASLSAALAGGAVYAAFRGGSTGYLEFVRIWWFGDALGLLILTPMVLGFLPLGGRRQLDLVTYASLVVALAGLALVAVMALGLRPFGALPPRDAVVEAQRLMLLCAVLGLGFSALLTQLRARHAELANANTALHALNQQLEARVEVRTAELREANAKLERLASTDVLTGIANRRRLEETLEKEIERCHRYGNGFALMMIDLDRFKAVNDTFGHAAGDRVLQAFAHVLQLCMRSTDLVARYGGEEFAVMMPLTDLRAAAECAERARAAFAATRLEGVGQPLSASFGITNLRKGDDVARLLARADAALYEAKRAGRNRVFVAPD